MASTDPIPFNRASFVGGETENVIEAIRGGHISGDGLFTRKCHELLQEALGAKRALSSARTSSSRGTGSG